MFNVISCVEMLLLFQLHSVQSLWGFSFTFLFFYVTWSSSSGKVHVKLVFVWGT